MIPFNLLGNPAVQIVIDLILLAWCGWISNKLFAMSNTVSEIHGMLTNDFHELPARVQALEDIRQKKSSAVEQ